MNPTKLDSRPCCSSARSRRAARAVAESLERRLCLSAATFAPAASYPAGFDPIYVAVGDFNGDGKPDLAVADYFGGVDVLLGNGNGTFKPAVSYAAGNTPLSIAVGDFNRDGKQDLAVADNSGGVDVLLGNGDGTFKSAVSYRAGTAPVSIAAGDFNRDGKTDLAVTNQAGVDVLLGNGNGTFKTAVSYAAGSFPDSVAVGDFNADGKSDLAITNDDSQGSVSVLLGNGNGTFKTAVSYPADSYAYSIGVGDFNSDGKPDLAVTNLMGGVDVLMGNGNGTFQATVSHADGGSPESVSVGDFNGDSQPDLAVADLNGGADVLLGKGNAGFKAPVAYAAGNGPESVAVGDFNGDGKPDLAVADFLGGVDVLLNTTQRIISALNVGTSAIVDAPLGQPVATFDANFADSLTATINYGDGAYGPGTIKSEGGGKYAIFGSHTFLAAGNDIMSVTLSDTQGPLASGQGFAVVREAPLVATGATGTIAANGGFSGVIARFIDPNPHPRASEFFGTIYWGDGSASPATFAASRSGSFDVRGSHVYLRSGPESPLVVILDTSGATATATAMLTSAVPSMPTVTGFDLIDGATGAVISALANNATVSLSASHIARLDIAALAAATASMTFNLNGKYVGLTSKAPFTLAGANSALGSGLQVGTYTLIAQPFGQTIGRGIEGGFTTVRFNVIA